MTIKGQNIPQSSVPEVQKLDAKAYSIELQRHESTYNHNNIHAPGSDAETATSVGALILGAAEKTTPVNTDMLPVMDTDDSNKVRKLSWSNIKTTLKTYFDTLYAANTSGTFTPVITFGGSSTDITYLAQVGRYTKIGNIVTVTGYVCLSSKGLSTGNMIFDLNDFPYAVKNTSNYYGIPSFYGNAFSGISGQIMGLAVSGSKFVYLYFSGTGTRTRMTDVHFTNDTDFGFSITFEVN